LRKILQPRSNKQDHIYPAPKQTKAFQYGVVKDAPATNIPDGSLADAFNVKVFPTEVLGREGCELYTNEVFPPIEGRTGYSASKTGNIITATTNIFSQEDVGNFWVWPDGTNDEIVEYISFTQVRTNLTFDRDIKIGCYIRGKNNYFRFHEQQRKWVWLVGRKFYWAGIGIPSFQEILTISRDEPTNAKADYKDLDEHSGLVFSSSGIYKIDFDTNPVTAYKINTPIPTKVIPAIAGPNTYAYRYLYCMSRMQGAQIIRDRLTPSRIDTEGGANQEDVITVSAGEDKLFSATEIDATNTLTVGPLYVPVISAAIDDEYQWHYTHYSIYRTKDTEAYRKINAADSQGHLNNPDRFIWAKDLRICGAFYGTRATNQIHLTVGEFELADVGSTIEWDDGTTITITAFVSSIQASFVGANAAAAAGAIGNGRVMRVTQTGFIVTRTAGDTYAATDVRKTIHFADGGRGYITEYIDANRVAIHQSVERTTMGCTIDPVYRKYNDSITDAQLESRITTLSLKQRYWTPLPPANIGVLPPGFVVTAARNDNVFYYSQIPEGYEYLAGYHNAALQLSKVIKGNIQLMWVFPDKIVIWTSGKTYHTPTNQPYIVSLPEVGEGVATLPGTEVLDSNKGLFDWGSVQNTGNGRVRLFTSEEGFVGVREFNGNTYSSNLAYIEEIGMGRMAKDLNNWYPATCTIYNGVSGYVAWGKKKNAT